MLAAYWKTVRDRTPEQRCLIFCTFPRKNFICWLLIYLKNHYSHLGNLAETSFALIWTLLHDFVLLKKHNLISMIAGTEVLLVIRLGLMFFMLKNKTCWFSYSSVLIRFRFSRLKYVSQYFAWRLHSFCCAFEYYSVNRHLY